ncbi:MAG: MarR family transcriptional regulator [Halobacteriales archaeon]
MPISKDRFEEIGNGEDGPTPGTNAAEILAFLRDNPDKAFTQSEIADATEVKAGSVGPTLVRLRERGRVDHRGKYWGVSDHDQSLDATTRHASATMAEHETDGETPEMAEWQEHAVDPRDHRDEQ